MAGIRGLYEAIKTVSQTELSESTVETPAEPTVVSEAPVVSVKKIDNSGIDKPGRLNYAQFKASVPKKPNKSLQGDGYAPRPEGERRFAAKHLDNVVKREDPAGNGDDVFKASNVKAISREAENHGYDPGDDEDIYEESQPSLGRHIKDMHVHNDKGGVRVYYNHDYNEYRIVPYAKKDGKEVRSKEKSWGFTDDKKDAEGTAKDMHKRLHGSEEVSESFLDTHQGHHSFGAKADIKLVRQWLHQNPKHKYRESVVGGMATRKQETSKEELEHLLTGVPVELVFESGETHDISEADALLLSTMYNTLDEENQELFVEMLTSSKESFYEVRDFVINHNLGVDDDGI